MEETKEVKPNKNHLKGFGSNPQNINRKGRPKGSRNKASMKQARDLMDGNIIEYVQYLEAMMRGDKVALDTNIEVPLAVRLKATESLVNKVISNEKDNKALEELERKAEAKQADEVPEDEEDDGNPLFSATAH